MNTSAICGGKLFLGCLSERGCRVALPMTASFHGNVDIFTALQLNNPHGVIQFLIRIGRGVVGRRPKLKSDEFLGLTTLLIEII